jgi:putative endonuclease
LDVSQRKSSTGRKGEDAAARFLIRQGCTILARNWQANPGEVDIVAKCPPLNRSQLTGEGESPILAFIEVRTRHGRRGLAEESISRRKAASMAQAAYAYLEAYGLDLETTSWRIDLVTVAITGSGVTTTNWIQSAIDETML